MKLKEFVENKIQEGKSQSQIAREARVSQATINKILFTDTQPTLETLKKFASAYQVPVNYFINEEETEYRRAQPRLNEKEEKMLRLFRSLNERRQDRILETMEDMALALRESHERERPENISEGSNSKRKSGG